MKTFVKISVISTISILFTWWVYGFAVVKNDVIVKRTSDYLYVKKYSWYNKDSTIHKYYADKIYQGVVFNKRKHRHFVGVPGKGGHYRTKYSVVVKYDNTEHKFGGYNIYNKYNEGDKVRILVRRYPYYSIDLLP